MIIGLGEGLGWEGVGWLLGVRGGGWRGYVCVWRGVEDMMYSCEGCWCWGSV